MDFGLAQMPAVGTDIAISALRDAKAEGFRGVIISGLPSGEAKLSAADDPFWAEAERLEMPVHVHVGLSQAGKRKGGAAAKAA